MLCANQAPICSCPLPKAIPASEPCSSIATFLVSPESFKIQYLQFLAYTKTPQYKANLQQLLDQEKVHAVSSPTASAILLGEGFSFCPPPVGSTSVKVFPMGSEHRPWEEAWLCLSYHPYMGPPYWALSSPATGPAYRRGTRSCWAQHSSSLVTARPRRKRSRDSSSRNWMR